jgi:biotin carboxyl carrier protein
MVEQYSEFVVDDAVYITKVNKKFTDRKHFTGFKKHIVTAFIPGAIREVLVQAGQHVTIGEKMLVLEAMKMKNLVVAPMSGIIKTVNAAVGENVSKNQILVEIEPDKVD